MTSSDPSCPPAKATLPMMPQAMTPQKLPIDDRHLSIRPVAQPGLRKALALLLTGRQTASELAVDQFLNFANSRNMGLERFWIVHEQSQATAIDKAAEDDPGHPLLAVLTIQAPGRAGMLFVSPIVRQHDINAASAAIGWACEDRFVSDLTLVQMLLDPFQRYERQAALEGGFADLAHLQYMRRRVGTHRPLTLPDGLSLSSWSLAVPDTRKWFAEAILASYTDTMDCPRLVGLRQIDDIIAGHMGAGPFNPDLWQVLHRGNEPLAVMLINTLSSRDAVELAYLGLCPALRGQGWGKALMEHGLWLASTHKAREMLLAVDENNTPALKLYNAMKFTPTARKLALLRTVRPV